MGCGDNKDMEVSYGGLPKGFTRVSRVAGKIMELSKARIFLRPRATSYEYMERGALSPG
jgi:hypothetical protein